MPRNTDKVPCGIAGCKAWAVHGSDPPRCSPHSGRASAPPGNTNQFDQLMAEGLQDLGAEWGVKLLWRPPPFRVLRVVSRFSWSKAVPPFASLAAFRLSRVQAHRGQGQHGGCTANLEGPRPKPKALTGRSSAKPNGKGREKI
jgi:hypothetical protein